MSQLMMNELFKHHTGFLYISFDVYISYTIRKYYIRFMLQMPFIPVSYANIVSDII